MTLEQQQAWAAQWKRSASALARVRADEERVADLSTTAAQLEGAVRAALAVMEPRLTSGLVEQQRIFHLRRA
jgi:hypothetical protein